MESIEPLYDYTFNGMIWGSCISNDAKTLVLDVRNQKTEKVEYYLLDFEYLTLEVHPFNESTWWSSLHSYGTNLIIREYHDKNDVNQQKLILIDGTSRKEVANETVAQNTPIRELKYPMVYDVGTEHFKTVSQYLSLELPLSCEYLEWDEKIILSYYLRSDIGFDRHLVVIQDGKRALELHQDHGMKGFASGAFFVLREWLVVIKNGNEVCIYSF